jgi:N-acetylglucosaminyl-diphospho-decaprenol L-rhamnosyltransferase
MGNEVTLSVVSHGQIMLINNLFRSLERFHFEGKVILTINIVSEVLDRTYNLDISFIYNQVPLGFGANHNNAFKFCTTKYFAIVNPDLIFQNNIFDKLINTLEENSSIGVLGTGSKNSKGVQQDNARSFPTFLSLFLKLIGIRTHKIYSEYDGLIESDWISGQFMFFKSSVFLHVNGFSPKFYMYYEDVDICKRLRNLNYLVMLNTGLTVIHDARRASHFNFKLFFIHLRSGLKYFFS